MNSCLPTLMYRKLKYVPSFCKIFLLGSDESKKDNLWGIYFLMGLYYIRPDLIFDCLQIFIMIELVEKRLCTGRFLMILKFDLDR